MQKNLYSFILLLLVCPVFLFAQTNPSPDIVIGVQRFQAQTNYLHNYYIPAEDVRSPDLKSGWGFKLDLMLPSTKVTHFNYVIGMTYQNANYNYFGEKTDPGLKPHFFGGGMYAGVSTTIGFKDFGLLAQICSGYFIFNQKVNFIARAYEQNAVSETLVNSTISTFGGKVNIGLYNTRGKLTIIPNFYCIIMGLTDKGASAILGVDLSVSFKY